MPVKDMLNEKPQLRATCNSLISKASLTELGSRLHFVEPGDMVDYLKTTGLSKTLGKIDKKNADNISWNTELAKHQEFFNLLLKKANPDEAELLFLICVEDFFEHNKHLLQKQNASLNDFFEILNQATTKEELQIYKDFFLAILRESIQPVTSRATPKNETDQKQHAIDLNAAHRLESMAENYFKKKMDSLPNLQDRYDEATKKIAITLVETVAVPGVGLAGSAVANTVIGVASKLKSLHGACSSVFEGDKNKSRWQRFKDNCSNGIEIMKAKFNEAMAWSSQNRLKAGATIFGGILLTAAAIVTFPFSLLAIPIVGGVVGAGKILKNGIDVLAESKKDAERMKKFSGYVGTYMKDESYTLHDPGERMESEAEFELQKTLASGRRVSVMLGDSAQEYAADLHSSPMPTQPLVTHIRDNQAAATPHPQSSHPATHKAEASPERTTPHAQNQQPIDLSKVCIADRTKPHAEETLNLAQAKPHDSNKKTEIKTETAHRSNHL